MKFELFNAKNEVMVSADIQGVGKSWLHPGAVTYAGDTGLLDWFNTPASGDMVGFYFRAAARKHGLRYECDTMQILPD